MNNTKKPIDKSSPNLDGSVRDKIFIQGSTLHYGGGITIEENGRFVQICLGAEQQHQSSFYPADAIRVANHILALSRAKIARKAVADNPPSVYDDSFWAGK